VKKRHLFRISAINPILGPAALRAGLLDQNHQNHDSWGSLFDALLQFFFVAGGPSRADFLKYLTKGAIIWGFKIGFLAGTQVQQFKDSEIDQGSLSNPKISEDVNSKVDVQYILIVF
jgi:hypothetical protein